MIVYCYERPFTIAAIEVATMMLLEAPQDAPDMETGSVHKSRRTNSEVGSNATSFRTSLLPTAVNTRDGDDLKT